MTVMLTNDDGIECEGLLALANTLKSNHDVWVLAPDSERSGMSHAMSLKTPCKIRRIEERFFSCSGTTADCVILAHLGILPVRPDIVISGINRGPNLGTDLIYSGTASGARQASLFGWPGIAVSLATYQPPFHFFQAAAFIRDHIGELVDLWDASVFINVNIPNSETSCPGWSFAVPSVRTYHDKLKSFEAPDAFSYCFLTDGKIETRSTGSDTDAETVAAGLAAVSRVLVQPAVLNGKPSQGER